MGCGTRHLQERWHHHWGMTGPSDLSESLPRLMWGQQQWPLHTRKVKWKCRVKYGRQIIFYLIKPTLLITITCGKLVLHPNRPSGLFNPFSTRPHQNAFWYNNSWIRFSLKFWIIYQKKEKNFLQKISPHLSQLNVAMAHRNYFRQNNLWILKVATYIQRLKITILGAKFWQFFRLEKDCQMFIFYLSTQNIKFYWFVMKIKKFLLPIWWYNRGVFPLGNEYFGVFVRNPLWIALSH